MNQRRRAATRIDYSKPLLLAVSAFGVWLLVGLVGCASLTPKQQAENIHGLVRLALTALDDAEHDLCLPAATVPHDCTNPDAAKVGLTSAANQQIAAKLVEAFKADKLVSLVIQSWKAGDPAPADLPALLADVQAAFNVVKSFAPSGSLFDKAQKVLDEVNSLVKVFGGGN